MATRPDVTEFITHEERVRAFMASIPGRRRRRVEAKFPLIGDQPELEIGFSDPAVFEQLEVTGLPVHKAQLRTLPDYAEGS